MISSLVWAVLIPTALGGFIPQARSPPASYLSTCKAIAKAISPASDVFYPGSTSYEDDISHWLASSTEQSACSVEPGSARDVSAILQVLGKTNTPFAIKSAGHGTSKGYSSTVGVQIALVRFNTVSYDKKAGTATIGTGLSWDQVYKKLERYNVTVAGGRIKGVGVGGLILGGGYSFISNQRGLSVDSVVSFELVLPSSKIVTVSKSSYPDLFFGLRGGFNNFGIVTKVTMQTFYQGPVWYKSTTYYGDSIPKFFAALSAYDSSQKDPNGSILVAGTNGNGTYSLTLSLFYNDLAPPQETYAVFDGVTAATTETVVLSFYDFLVKVSGPPTNPPGFRGAFNTVTIPIESIPVVTEVFNQAKYYSGPGYFGNNTQINYAMESFSAPAIERPLNDSAYPHVKYGSPVNLYYGWYGEENDAIGIQAIKDTATAITKVMIKEGQDVNGVALYANYALPDASLKSLYGPNLPVLKALRKKWDPTGVMLRAGGFKLV